MVSILIGMIHTIGTSVDNKFYFWHTCFLLPQKPKLQGWRFLTGNFQGTFVPKIRTELQFFLRLGLKYSDIAWSRCVTYVSYVSIICQSSIINVSPSLGATRGFEHIQLPVDVSYSWFFTRHLRNQIKQILPQRKQFIIRE